MKTLSGKIAANEKNYCVKIGHDLLKTPEKWLPNHYESLVVITDNTVRKKMANAFFEILKKNHNVLLLSIPAGEKSKNINTYETLINKMLNHGCSRHTLIIAMGGGVVTDIAGFVAATYMRGIDYLNVPTTLLAMIDSSIGGKCGVNMRHGKNLIGAFHQPKKNIIDLTCLAMLPEKHFVNGLFEILKTFLISDVNGVKFFQANLTKIISRDKKIIQNLIERAVKIKINVIERDEKDNSLRIILNFGHTIGHALEKNSDYKMLHGYAVAYGMLFEAKISVLKGILAEADFNLIQSLLSKLNINISHLQKFNVKKIVTNTRVDKKNKNGAAHYVLLKKPGKVYEHKNQFAHAIEDHIVKKAFIELMGI